MVPGGTLFAPGAGGGGWWHFSVGRLPRQIGVRHPEPGWQGAFDRMHLDTAPGYTFEPIPAGLFVKPAGAPHEGVEALRYSLPVDPDAPVVLVGEAERAAVRAWIGAGWDQHAAAVNRALTRAPGLRGGNGGTR